MNIRQRIDVISRIADEFHDNRDWEDVETLLRAYKIKGLGGGPEDWERRAYVKSALRDIPESDLVAIAVSFDIQIPSLNALTAKPPKGWESDDKFRLFISHLAIHKDNANRLKETLAPHHIAAFVAHEDVTPTREWQREIEGALWTMDAMLSVHTDGFSLSPWTQQEIGWALGRGIRVIPLRMDEDLKGFISKDQAILRRKRQAPAISHEIASILADDAATKRRMDQVIARHKQVEDDEIPF